jgi:hypothetical protein
MGFTIYYRSTRAVSQEEAEVIGRAARDACRGRTWLNCEPVHFFSGSEDGCLFGGSKPNFRPHPDDVASAARRELPHGGVRDMLEVLCRLSREHDLDWEISHDHSGGPVGLIRAGECDRDVLAQVEAFADVAEYLGSLSEEEFGGP